MTDSQKIQARVKGAKAFQRKVRKLRLANPGMGYAQAAGLTKLGFKQEKPVEEKPVEEKHQQFVLVIGDGAYKLLSLSNGNGVVKVEPVSFQLVKL